MLRFWLLLVSLLFPLWVTSAPEISEEREAALWKTLKLSDRHLACSAIASHLPEDGYEPREISSNHFVKGAKLFKEIMEDSSVSDELSGAIGYGHFGEVAKSAEAAFGYLLGARHLGLTKEIESELKAECKKITGEEAEFYCLTVSTGYETAASQFYSNKNCEFLP